VESFHGRLERVFCLASCESKHAPTVCWAIRADRNRRRHFAGRNLQLIPYGVLGRDKYLHTASGFQQKDNTQAAGKKSTGEGPWLLELDDIRVVARFSDDSCLIIQGYTGKVPEERGYPRSATGLPRTHISLSS
jgi:hypothetical protein